MATLEQLKAQFLKLDEERVRLNEQFVALRQQAAGEVGRLMGLYGLSAQDVGLYDTLRRISKTSRANNRLPEIQAPGLVPASR